MTIVCTIITQMIWVGSWQAGVNVSVGLADVVETSRSREYQEDVNEGERRVKTFMSQ